MALFVFFQWDGVPPAIICYSSKKMTQCEFNGRHKEASCYLQQTEPFPPWSNAVERETKEPKKYLGRKIIKSKAPCLELESYMPSNAAHDMYRLDENILKKVMWGEISNISQFCEMNGWMDDVSKWKCKKYWDDQGSYLEPSINFNPTMSEKIWLRLARPSIWPHVLTQEEWGSENSKVLCRTFMESFHQRHSPQAMVDDLACMSTVDMPQNDPYEDGSQHRKTSSTLE